MTQEDRDLLFKDLCARLPYEVKAHYKYYDLVGGTEQLVAEDDAIITGVNTTLGNPIRMDGYCVEVEYVKPYLRPMSSMTKEEESEYCSLKLEVSVGRLLVPSYNTIDWLNKHYFDYRGLITKGLALEAPEGMYKYD